MVSEFSRPDTFDKTGEKPDDMWVFAYGSLMWNPGFAHAEVRPAQLFGYHRAFCLYSHHYRGTVEKPGLVLGLDRGGSCRGRAYRVAEEHADAALAYLTKREMYGHEVDVYELHWLELDVEGEHVAAARIKAACFIANPAHPHYAGKLSLERVAELIRSGVGENGSNVDYLLSTVQHLDELGINDGPLHELVEMVGG